jgi:hypothetical protein
MGLIATAHQGKPIARLRFHPREPLLAGISGPRAEVCIWRCDARGSLDLLWRVDQGDAPRVANIAWHPYRDMLALVDGGPSIELWSGGHFLKSLDTSPVPGLVRDITSANNIITDY